MQENMGTTNNSGEQYSQLRLDHNWAVRISMPKLCLDEEKNTNSEVSRQCLETYGTTRIHATD